MRSRMLVATVSLFVANAAVAQTEQSTAATRPSEGRAPVEAAPAKGESLGKVTIQGEPIFPNRTDDVNPVLNFGQEYFQRFEPTSAGQMLKRLPGVSFVNDVGEYQAPKLRGLPAGYTQVLLNGERLPASSGNRSPLVDRIPFELIQRVEIVRSPSAEIDSQGPAGTLNIVTKKPAEFEGGSVTLGGAYASALGDKRRATDSDFFSRASVLFSGNAGPMDFIVNGSFTERYNPKLQDTSVFDPNNGNLQEFSSQADTRDTEDLALNFRSTIKPKGGKTEVSIDGFVVHTDRIERENEITFERGSRGFTPPFGSEFFDEEVNVDVDQLRDRASPVAQETETEDIEQLQYGAELGFKRPLGRRLDLEASVNLRRFEEDRTNRGLEKEFNPDGSVDESTRTRERMEIDNPSYTGKLDFDYKLNERQDLAYGLQARVQDRETEFQVVENGSEVTDQSFDIDENVYAGYLEHKWRITDKLTMQHGLRLEATELQTRGAGVGSSDESYVDLNPTVSYRYDLTEKDRIHFSVARTIRRPDFNELEPFLITEEPGNGEATRGTPGLEPERSWGLDLGYQHNFANGRGIVGINLFYRDISNVIELTDTGNQVTRGGDTFDEYQFLNAGDGELYGVEADFSAPLTFVGLPRTALFTNGTLLDSEVKDAITGESREFTRTPNWVLNAGVNQKLPAGFAVGASVHAEGDVRDTQASEITEQEQEPFVQAFLEKKFQGGDTTLRLVAANLLDRAKIEHKRNFESAADRQAGNPEDRELEVEQRGRVFKLVLRSRF